MKCGPPMTLRNAAKAGVRLIVRYQTPGGIRGSCGGDVAIVRRRRDAEAVRDLSYADVGISKHRLGGLDVVIRQFRRTASGAAYAPRGGKARLRALPDQTALEFGIMRSSA